MSQGIENKVVVITGASSGLGEATARRLAERGATVVLDALRRDRIGCAGRGTRRKHGGRERSVRKRAARRPLLLQTMSNLALFYDDYRWDGLIRLGRFDGGFAPLLVRGAYPVRIERI
jgi:NAD(P)-dependent dehydrogenase (short-subunit alcohol dehydrogenase family)